MKCLVTGGLGFIGSHLVDELIKQGHKVYIVDNLSTGKRENLNPKAVFYENGIVSRTFWKQMHEVDVVYHTAALPRIQPSIKNPIKSHKTNVNGTLNVLEYCRRYKAKLIFSGSSSIFKGDSLPTKETDAKEPKSPYSLQKWLCEQYIELYHKLYGLDYVILRYFNVYGPRQLTEGAYACVLGIFLNQKEQGKPLTITNDGEQRRDFTHVKDVVRANIMAIDWQGTFNIGAGKNYSINELADLVGGEKEYIGYRKGEVKSTLCDNSKAQSMGWKPEYKLEEHYND